MSFGLLVVWIQLTKKEWENLKSQFASSSDFDFLRSQFVTLEKGRGK
jgi:hypothetical protein